MKEIKLYEKCAIIFKRIKVFNRQRLNFEEKYDTKLPVRTVFFGILRYGSTVLFFSVLYSFHEFYLKSP